MDVVIPVGLGVRALKWMFPEASDALDTLHGAYRTWRTAAALQQLGDNGDGDGDGGGDGAQDAEW
jgi:hypothetical protein